MQSITCYSNNIYEWFTVFLLPFYSVIPPVIVINFSCLSQFPFTYMRYFSGIQGYHTQAVIGGAEICSGTRYVNVIKEICKL